MAMKKEKKMRLYLNEREYNGRVYYLCDFRGEGGILTASCMGYEWGLDTGTCLAGLTDEKGNGIRDISRAGMVGDYDFKRGTIENLHKC